MIREGFEPITEERYLYCDECGMMFPVYVDVEFHVCEPPEAEPSETDPLGVRGGAT